MKEFEGRAGEWLCDSLNPQLNIVPDRRMGYHRVQIRCEYPKDLTPGQKKRLMKEVKEKGCKRSCTRERGRAVCLIDLDVIRKIVKVVKSGKAYEVKRRSEG